jgi:hypothetical protein
MLFAALLAAAISASYPPAGCMRMHSDDSPRHSFTVEEYSCGDAGTAVWLRSQDGRVAQLYARSGSIIEPYVYISPDERWIVCVQKLYHGASGAWLYERSTGLTYREVTPSPFSDRAWEFFRRQTHRSFQQDYRFIISTGTFSPESRSLLVELTGDDGKTVVRSWYCYYDLQKHRFYLDAALTAKNQNAVSTHK